MGFGINKMKSFLKNPMSLWFIWYFRSRRLIRKNKGKHIVIGYLTTLKNVQFGSYNTFYANIIVINSKIGDFVYVGNNTMISRCEIGSYCSIGHNVQIGLGMHPTNYLSTFPAFFSIHNQCQISFAKENHFNEFGYIKIGNDVWIGANVIIMDNVTIGDGAVIAAGAIVTKDVEPFTIVGGVPAKKIKLRFSEDKVKSILDSKWWNKDVNWLKENISNFQKPIN